MYIQAILSTVQTTLRGKLKLNVNLGICGSGMLREGIGSFAGGGDPAPAPERRGTPFYLELKPFSWN